MKYIVLSVFIVCNFLTSAQTARITFKAPWLYPEGTAYTANGHFFFVSSVKTGTIGKVDGSGNYTVFFRDSLLKSTYGMKVQEDKRRLWVCVSDANYSDYTTEATFKKLAKIIVLDMTTGKKVNDINLAELFPGKHFANDLTFDQSGNAYVTDSFSPVIYKIDAGGSATVFAQSELFKSGQVGLNGIVWHPGGYLLAAHNSAGTVLKIPLNNPGAVTTVAINTFFPGADGLLLTKENELVLVQNKGVNKIFRLSSKDNWQSAEIKQSTAMIDRFQNPTTATFRGNEIWVLNAKLNELADSTMGTSREFSLQQAILK